MEKANQQFNSYLYNLNKGNNYVSSQMNPLDNRNLKLMKSLRLEKHDNPIYLQQKPVLYNQYNQNQIDNELYNQNWRGGANENLHEMGLQGNRPNLSLDDFPKRFFKYKRINPQQYYRYPQPQYSQYSQSQNIQSQPNLQIGLQQEQESLQNNQNYSQLYHSNYNNNVHLPPINQGAQKIPMVPIKNLESPMSPLNRSPMSSKVYFYNRYDNNTEKDIFSVKPPNNSERYLSQNKLYGRHAEPYNVKTSKLLTKQNDYYQQYNINLDSKKDFQNVYQQFSRKTYENLDFNEFDSFGNQLKKFEYRLKFLKQIKEPSTKANFQTAIERRLKHSLNKERKQKIYQMLLNEQYLK